MDPQRQFCHNPDCSAKGQVGRGTSLSIAKRSSAIDAPHVVGLLLRPWAHPSIAYGRPWTS